MRYIKLFEELEMPRFNRSESGLLNLDKLVKNKCSLDEFKDYFYKCEINDDDMKILKRWVVDYKRTDILNFLDSI